MLKFQDFFFALFNKTILSVGTVQVYFLFSYIKSCESLRCEDVVNVRPGRVTYKKRKLERSI